MPSFLLREDKDRVIPGQCAACNEMYLRCEANDTGQRDFLASQIQTLTPNGESPERKIVGTKIAVQLLVCSSVRLVICRNETEFLHKSRK